MDEWIDGFIHSLSKGEEGLVEFIKMKLLNEAHQ